MNSIEASYHDLTENLSSKIDKKSRIALVGIGNEMRHDDFVGMFIIQELKKKGLQKDNILLVAAGDSASSYIVELNDWKPDYIIMIDAVDAKKPVGTVCLLEKDQLHSHSVDSHSNAKILLLDFVLGLNPS